MRKLADSIVLAFGWRRAIIAFVAGAVSVLALPPFHLWPILFFTFPVLVWLVDGAAAGRLGGVPSAAFAGWSFGFGYFLAGLYWIGNAFLVDAKIFGWLLPFAVMGLPAYLAIFPALGLGLARFIWVRGPTRLLALAAALTVAEWLRAHALTGFPWNSFGYVLTGPLVLAQSAALFGLWGLTFFALLVFASPAILADDPKQSRWRALPLALSFGFLAALAVYGSVRLARTPTAFVDNVRLRIMQPNLSQDQKFNYAAKADVMRRYLALSDRATSPQSSGMKDVTHLIWPESAFPFFLPREADALAQIAELLPPGASLITGGVREAQGGESGRPTHAYNSIYVLDHEASIVAVYDKVHLVPFGEYLPLQSWLEQLGLMQLTKVKGGFVAGDRYRTYSVAGLPRFLPLVCYEVIFPEAAFIGGERPSFLLNLTNDGWFGISTGPYQHLHQARIRAIEQGLPLVRAANTGISAVVDPLGRVVKSLPLGAEGVLDAQLPRAIDPPFYARTGDGFAAMLLGLAGLVLARKRLRPRGLK